MDLSWSDKQAALHKQLRVYGEKLGQRLIERDRAQEFSRSDWNGCAEQGVLRLAIPHEYDGLDLDALTCAYAMEGLGYGCRDNGLLVSLGAHMWTVQLAITKFGTEEQRTKYLRPLSDGRLIGANAVTEPDAGSNALSLKTTARREGDHYVLKGEKCFITNAPIADLFLVFATINPKLGFTGVTAFLVERDQLGIHVETRYEKTGLRTSPWGEVILQDCRVAASQRLGREKGGSAIFATMMAWERALILAPLLGAMERELEGCIVRARKRRQFSRPIGAFQAVSHSIVEMKVELEAARLLTYRAAWDLDRDYRSMFSEIAQLKTSESALDAFLRAMQVYGAYGYTINAEIERSCRDALGTRISSGTSDLQRMVIAKKLGVH
jgi:alkylation response protein AidB-like acyl-CoA dehydrogenase